MILFLILILSLSNEKYYEVDVIELNTRVNYYISFNGPQFSTFNQYIFYRWNNEKIIYSYGRKYDASYRYNVVFNKTVLARQILSDQEIHKRNVKHQNQHGSSYVWVEVGDLILDKLPYYDRKIKRWILYFNNKKFHARVFRITITSYDVEQYEQQILPSIFRDKL